MAWDHTMGKQLWWQKKQKKRYEEGPLELTLPAAFDSVISVLKHSCRSRH